MAAVIRSRDRGQLILVAGLTVAVILVMLVLLLNTVIYTENLATRGIDSGAGDAIEYRATVVGSVEELVERENEHYDAGDPPEVGVEVGVGMIDETLSERYLGRSTIAEVRSFNVVADESSPRIWQNESRVLTDAEGRSDWTVMTEATEFDRFEMTVTPDEYTENEAPFRIDVDDWSMEIDVVEVTVGEEGNTVTEERIVVTIEGEETSIHQYEPGAAPLEIDLAGGSIEADNGSEHDEIEPPTPDRDPLRYENGDRVTGTFELHATGTQNGSDLTEYDGGSSEGPYYTYTVESVDLTIHYETSQLRFVTEETVRTEEP
jgi:hypothetical protein